MGKWNWYCDRCDFKSGKSRHIDNHKRLHKREDEYYEIISKIPSIEYIPEFNKGGKLNICMIEFRESNKIKHVINSILRIYKPIDIGLSIVHGNLNKNLILKEFGNWKNINLINLNFNNINTKIYNKLLKKPEIWENFSNWSHVLIIQTDALLLKMIDDIYFSYDYIGAPWNNKCNKGGNGGFSLRNVKKMIKLTEFNKNKSLKDIISTQEDLFFSNNNLKIPNNFLIHKKFAVEKLFYSNPIGIHAIYKEITFSNEQWESLINFIKKSLYN